MNNLIIIGASALGREACSYARACGITVKGFLDSRKDVLEGMTGYPPIIGDPLTYEIEKEDVFICAVGDGEDRCRYVGKVAEKGGRFISIIHPTCVIGDNVKLGVGCLVRPFAVIGNDSEVGDHVVIGTQSLVAHDCVVKDFVTISPGCHVAGWCKLGSRAFLGIHSAVIPHVVIGESVFVAAGAVVVKDVAEGRVMGVPARQCE